MSSPRFIECQPARTLRFDRARPLGGTRAPMRAFGWSERLIWIAIVVLALLSR